MDSVTQYRDELQRLQSVWDNLTLLGQLSGTRADMSATRKAFQGLTTSLLNQLGSQTLKKTVTEISSKAQVAIDILVRNLYERTADIGFLATDDDVRRYVQQAGQATDADELAALNAGMRQRFAEYVAKYSVYSNILVLDTSGRVLVSLVEQDLPERTTHELLSRSLHTKDNYVESFGHIDLVPGADKSLVYSYRITDSAQNKLGVICLVFRLQNEADGIFSALCSSDDWPVLTYVDGDGCVIASSDESQARVGACVPPSQGHWKLVKFAGREYLAITQTTKGYQGYMGPGWFGQIMVPVEHAFAHAEGGALDLSEEIMRYVTHHSALFDQGLRAIPIEAKHIQRGLNRSVWNGNIHKSRDGENTNQSFSKIILWEISNTGARTKAVFEQSISNLNHTVISSIVEDSLFQASLAIDIMDRNLYERANDCRWWALTTDFRNILSKSPMQTADQQRIGAILKYINSLYTVYSNLMVYDNKGVVVAVSNDRYGDLVGQPIETPWVRDSLALQSAQEYVVSEFAATPLYEDRHTYVYAAAIRDPSGARVVGGVGIIFDAAPQFEAMLLDSLPRNESGAIPEGCFGALVHRDGQVIASTSTKMPVGAASALPPNLLNLTNGQGLATITAWEGTYYAVGSRMSCGYREYKNGADRYHNDVAALIFFPLCVLNGASSATALKMLKIDASPSTEATLEIATFHVGDRWYGMRAEGVLEAIESKTIAGSPRSTQFILGYLMYEGQPIAVIDFARIESGKSSASTQDGQIIITQTSLGKVGILVDGLGDIPEIAENRIQPIPEALVAEGSSIADAIIKHSQNDAEASVLVIVSLERIIARAMGNNA